MTTPLRNQLLQVHLVSVAEVDGVIAIGGEIVDGEGELQAGMKTVLLRALGTVDNDLAFAVVEGTSIKRVTPAKGEALCLMKTKVNGTFSITLTSTSKNAAARVSAELDNGVRSSVDIVYVAGA